MDIQADKQMDIQTDKQMDIQTDKQMDIQADKQMDIQADKQMDMQTDKQLLQDVLQDVKSLRQELHLIPEAAFHEFRTKARLMAFLSNLEHIRVVDRGQWFYAVYRGKNNREHTQDTPGAIAFRADYDAVTGKDGKPGHYCGHDGHSSILAGFAEYVNQVQPDRTIYFIFQPAEEIGQGALLCRGLLREEKEEPITEIYGFHNIPGYPQGTVLLLPGTFACASTGLEITITGTPSHAAYPEAGKNPAAMIAKLILLKEELLAKPHEGLIQATVIGVDLGSSAYGVSAGKGTLRLTLRGEKEAEFQQLVKDYSDAAMQLSAEEEMDCRIRRIEEFPATENHASGILRLTEAAQKTGKKILRPAEPFRWSEDFGYYLQYTRGAFFGIGSGENCPQLHTENYEFPDAIEETVLEMYAALL